MGHWIFIAILGIFGTRGYAVETPVANCEAMEIMKCLRETQKGGKLLFPDTQEKLQEYCKHLMAGLKCARDIIDGCVDEAAKDMYHNLTRDMVGMNFALCTVGSLRNRRFLKHVDCYKLSSDRFQTCSDRYMGNIVVVQTLTQEEQMGMTCCTIHEYNRCMRNAVDGRCEEDAHKLVEETVVTALKESIDFCKQQGDFPTSNCMKNFSPGNSHETSNLNDDNHANQLGLTNIFLMLLVFILVLSWS